MKPFIALALMAASASAQAPATNQVCTSNCPIDITHQTATSGATASHTNSSTSQAGNSTASNVSGVTVSPITQSSTGPQTQSQTGTQSASAANNGNTNSTGASTSNAKTGDNTNTIGVSGGHSSSNSQASGGSGGSGGSASGGKADAKGGTASVGSVSSGSSNGAQSLDTGHNSTVSNTNVKETFIPSMQPMIPPSSIAVANGIVEVTACGPRQHVRSDKMVGLMAGLVHTKEFVNGTTDTLEPFDGPMFREEPFRNGHKGFTQYGHVAIISINTIGMAAGRSFGGGGQSAGQAGGQAGFGGTSSIQQIATRIVLVECKYGDVVIEEPKPVELVHDPIVAFTPEEHDRIQKELEDWDIQRHSQPPAPPIATPVHHHKRKPIPACVPSKEK